MAQGKRERQRATDTRYGAGDVVAPRISVLVACKPEPHQHRKPGARAFAPNPVRRGKRRTASAWQWDIGYVATALENAVNR